MEKFKLFYENNRVYVILMAVSFFALFIILITMSTYFIFQTQKDIYGNRLNGTEVVEIKESKFKEIEKKFKEEKYVKEISLRLQGKIVHTTILLEDAKVDDAKNIAIKIMDEFSTKQKDIYDYSFGIDQEGEGFPIMGYKKAANTIISWTNNAR